MKNLSDQWQTPEWLFDELDKEFNFDIDLCATEENSRCELFGHDYLKNEYCYTLSSGHIYTMGSLHGAIREFYDYEYEAICFMNPPYSNPKPFIEKAWEDSKHCKIVCLVKCDPSTRWFAVFYDYDKQTPKPGCEIRFFPKRIKFDPPQQLIDSGEVFKVGRKLGYNKKWVQKCSACKGKGYKELSGPTFHCALIIMDRRNV